MITTELTKIEQLIYDLIQEYLNMNKIVDIEKVTYYINNKFSKSKDAANFPNADGIKTIIKNLINKNLIMEGSSLTYNQILENPKRKQIFDFIDKNPGAYHYQMMNRLEMPNQIVIWHLDMLVRFNYIQSFAFDNHVIYFKSGISRDNVIKGYFYNNPKSAEIINLLEIEKQGLTKTQISKRLSMHPNTVKKYTENLISNKILKKVRHNQKHLYVLN